MIKKVVETWHRVVAGELSEVLDGLLADDVVFYSPIVYTPQRGKAATTMYLRAAAQTLPGDPAHGAFHYPSRFSPATSPCSSLRRPSAANTSMASTSSAAMRPGASWSSG
jgi:hypothetical protein